MINKISEYVKNNKVIVFLILVTITNVLFFSMKTHLNFGIKIFMSVIIIITTFSLYFILNKIDKYSIEKKFLILFITFGIFYMFLIPLGQLPDEHGHFYRANEISRGHLISKIFDNGYSGRELPSNLSAIGNIKYSDIFNKLDIKVNKETSPFMFSNTALYSFVCYIPQVIGITISRVLNLPVIIQAYFGRLFNLLAFSLLIYFAIKIIPYKKEFIFLLCFCPMVIQAAVSLSPDSLTISSSILLICFTLKWMESKNKEKLKIKDYTLISILSIIVSQCKIVYLPICLIIFLIPYEKFGNKKRKYIFIGMLAALVCFLNLFWTSSVAQILEGQHFNGADSELQIKYILSHPLSYIRVILSDIENSLFAHYTVNLIGKDIAHFNVHLSTIIFNVFYIYFIIIFLSKYNLKEKISNNTKFLCFIIVLSSTLLIYTSLYLQWNPVGEKRIIGLQGRYFIPLILPLCLLFDNNLFENKKLFSNKIMNTMIIMININALVAALIEFI